MYHKECVTPNFLANGILSKHQNKIYFEYVSAVKLHNESSIQISLSFKYICTSACIYLHMNTKYTSIIVMCIALLVNKKSVPKKLYLSLAEQ